MGNFFKMFCTSCNAYGPDRETEAAAVSSWGRLVAREKRLTIKKGELTDKEQDVLDILKEAAKYNKPKPTNNYIAKVLCVSVNMPARYIKNLVKKNYITVTGSIGNKRVKIL
jgi:DNA-binding MarR family transcriptional regulator